jgi:hypothetical protein
LKLHYVNGLTGVRELERLPGLRNLRVVTDDSVLAQALTELDLSRFPELHRLRFGCHIDRTLSLDTTWIPGAHRLRELEIGAFTPASGQYVEIGGAKRLVRLDITALTGSDAEGLREALPLTALELHDPIELRNPNGIYPFDLIWELDYEDPHFSMSPELASVWGVYNEHEAELHLEGLTEEHDPDLSRRVSFDSEAAFQAISADSRYDLERVLKLAMDARSVKFERHLWDEIVNIQYDLSRRLENYDMWERRDVRLISIRLADRERDPRRLTATVSVNDGEAVSIVGDPDSDPAGAEMLRVWLTELDTSGDGSAPDHDRATEPLDALRRLATRVVRTLRRYHPDCPPILVDGIDPSGREGVTPSVTRR